MRPGRRRGNGHPRPEGALLSAPGGFLFGSACGRGRFRRRAGLHPDEAIIAPRSPQPSSQRAEILRRDVEGHSHAHQNEQCHQEGGDQRSGVVDEGEAQGPPDHAAAMSGKDGVPAFLAHEDMAQRQQAEKREFKAQEWPPAPERRAMDEMAHPQQSQADEQSGGDVGAPAENEDEKPTPCGDERAGVDARQRHDGHHAEQDERQRQQLLPGSAARGRVQRRADLARRSRRRR